MLEGQCRVVCRERYARKGLIGSEWPYRLA